MTNIKDMDLKSLKSIAYDLLTNIQLLQNDLTRVNNEIAMLQAKTVETKEDIKQK